MKHVHRVAIITGTLLLAGSATARAIEEPAFERIAQARPFELRQYRPMLVAETMVEGSMDEASNQGFRRIADFIFGNNLLPGSSPEAPRSQKIAMTAPVTAEPEPTLPAGSSWSTQPSSASPGGTGTGTSPAPAGSALTSLEARRWRIHFVMPAKYTLETLPKPKSNLVSVRSVPSRRCAVIVFSGFTDDEKVRGKTQQLMTWIGQQGLQPVGLPQVARYDPPWTLPFWRRNEVLIEVAETAAKQSPP